MEREFHIPMTERMEGEVEQMCNLSDGVEQRGIQKGIQQGIQQGIHYAVNILRKIGKADEDILTLIMDEYHLKEEEALLYL